ncbi:hypothetical protein EI94DRAFT_50347 [Lactarius quietus]|nr:hypothetical protein EI94DRAFT_50347 [Lactarius quietus]
MDSTPMYLHRMSDSSSEYDTTYEKGVTIRMPMFDMASASTTQYCATFDPNPPAPAPLRAEKCTENPVGKDRSQLFAFNELTGVVRPMWLNNQNNGMESAKGDCSVNAPPTPQNASLAGATEADTKNVTSTPSTAPETTGNSTVLSADIPQAAPSNSSGDSMSGAQKVALVFVAADPEVPHRPAVVTTSTTSSILATSTGAGASGNVVSTADGSSTTVMADSSSGSLTATSPAVLATVSGSSSVSASSLPSTASNAAISAPVSTVTPGSLPSSAAAAPGSNSTPTTVLGVQVVPTMEGGAPSTPSATPVMTPVSTQPYEWMFKPNPQP